MSRFCFRAALWLAALCLFISPARPTTAAPAKATSMTPTQPKADGYRGIWSFRGSSLSHDEYVYYHYSGGFATCFAKHVPMAYYAAEANKTFFCYGGAAKGRQEILIMASCYDHATGMVPRPTILMNKGTDDAHDNPAIMLDTAGHVWIFAAAHGTARPSFIFKSREPYSVDAFDLVLETNFSYPQPWHVESKGFLFLHTLYHGGRFLHWSTSPDGVEWSEPKMLAKVEAGHYQISWRRGKKVGTAFNYHPHEKLPNDMRRTNLYYLETDDFGETWHNAQGQAVEVPLVSPKNAALVHEYEAEDLRVYMKDMDFDPEGRPVILYLTSRGSRTGPEHGPRMWTTAAWTGERWDIRPAMTSDSNYDTGCLHAEPDGTWRIIGPTEPGPQPYNAGGEIAVWTSADQGKTWGRDRVATQGSPYNHSYARRPLNAQRDFYAFWADGHARELSESRLYFCDRAGEHVWRLPAVMENAMTRPEAVRD